MKLFYMTMWRFGNDYNIIADSEEKGRSALKKEYIKLYKIYNGEEPTGKEIREMLNDIEVTVMKLNTVFNPCVGYE